MKETQSAEPFVEHGLRNNTAVSLSQLKLPPYVSSTIYNLPISLSPLTKQSTKIKYHVYF